MIAHLIEDPAIERQLQGIVQALTKRLQLAGAGEAWHGWTARDLSAALAGRSTDQLAAERLGPSAAVAIILGGLIDPRAVEDVDLWGSPLGRALAYWGTGEPGSVSRSCAAAALGCTRANIALMVRSGRLSEAEGTCYPPMVTTASLAHAMRVKYPLGG